MRSFSRAGFALLVILSACTLGGARPDPPLPSSPAANTDPPAPTRLDDPARWKAQGSLVGIHDGRAYVANGGRLVAFELACRSGCEPVWRTSVEAWPTDLAFAGDRVFVPAGEHGIAVTPMECDEIRCRPTFHIRFDALDPTSHFDNLRKVPPSLFRLKVVGSILYVIAELDLADTTGIQPGRVMAFDVGCTPCRPLWRSPLGSGLLDEPTVHEDAIYVPASSGLSVFSVGCRSDGGTCSPLWTAPMNTAAHFMLMTRPRFSGDLVVELTQGYNGGGDADLPQIAAFLTDCRRDGGRCDPVWWYEIGRERFASGPVIFEGEAFVTTGGWNLHGMTFAFPLDCTGRCTPSRIFQAPGEFFRGPVIIRERLVIGAYRRGSISYFDVTCERDPCLPGDSWHAPWHVTDVAAISGGVVASSGRHLLVFRPPGRGSWEPRWRWAASRPIEDVRVVGEVALASTHTSVYAITLPN